MDQCVHMRSLTELKEARQYACEACLREGRKWVHLRTCQTCGVTLCCDTSPGRHMTAHFKETGHPVVISSEPGESWMWCYADELFIPY